MSWSSMEQLGSALQTFSVAQQTVESLVHRGISLREMLSARDAAKQIGIIDDSCTTGEFAHRVLIPATQATGMSYSEFIATERGGSVQPAQCHVVHSWRMKLEDLLVGIAEYANRAGQHADACSKEDLLNTQWHEAHRPENLEQRFFVCAFSVCQHTVADFPVGHPKCEIDKFHLIAKRIHEAWRLPMVVVLDKDRLTLTRSCCIEEIHTAITGNIPIHYAGPGCVTSTQKIDAMRAEAHEPLVQHMIFEKIRTMPGSFEAFNEILSEHVNGYAQHRLCRLRDLLVRTSKSHNEIESSDEDKSESAMDFLPPAASSLKARGGCNDSENDSAASPKDVACCPERLETPAEKRQPSSKLPTLLGSMPQKNSTPEVCSVSCGSLECTEDIANGDGMDCAIQIVQDTFRAFCGSRSDLDGKTFAKLCNDCGLVDAKFTTTSADLVFAKSVIKGTRRLDLSGFQAALRLVAEKKSVDLKHVLAKVASAEGPRLHKTTKAQAVRFHDDKSTYTGTHVHGGPDSGAKGIGSTGPGMCTSRTVNLGLSRTGDFY